MLDNTNFAKKTILDFIDFIRYKVENDKLMMEEMDSISKTIQENLVLYGTIDDLSSFYGKSKDAVNSVIKRRMIEKPRRNIVLYPFHVFRKLIPDCWRINRSRTNK